MSVRNEPLCMAPLRVRAMARGASPPDTRRMYFTVISGSADSSDRATATATATAAAASLTPSTPCDAEAEGEEEAEEEACSLLSGGLIVTTKPSNATRLAGSFKLDPMVALSASLKVAAETSAYDSPPTI